MKGKRPISPFAKINMKKLIKWNKIAIIIAKDLVLLIINNGPISKSKNSPKYVKSGIKKEFSLNPTTVNICFIGWKSTSQYGFILLIPEIT